MANSTYNFTRLSYWSFENKNCDHLIQIWHYLEYNKTELYYHWSAYGSKDDVYRYIVEGMEGFLRSNSLEKPPQTQEFWDWSVRLSYIVTSSGRSDCPSEMCRAIGWEGNPDLAGVGMLATYVIQAILVTFYLFSILILRFDWLPPRLQNSAILSRTLLAVQHSTAEFLSASSLFSLSLLVASTHLITQFDSMNRSTWILKLVIPLNSVLPAVILHVVASNMLRRSKGRVFVWLVIDALIISLIIRSSVVFRSVITGYYYIDTDPCVDSSFVEVAVFSYAVAGLLVLGITVYVVDSIGSMIRHRSRCRGNVVFIGWFVDLTNKIRSRAGDNNDDNKWTFGQVLALTTWVPFIVEFIYIWWEEPLEALNGRLMAPYEVVATSAQESLLEMESSRSNEASGRFQRL